MKKIVSTLLLIIGYAYCYAQTDRAFWFAAPDIEIVNNPTYGMYDRPIYLKLTSFNTPSNVTVSIPANSSFTPIAITIPANTTSTIDLTPWIDMIENFEPGNINNKGIYIQSTADITAYYEVNSITCMCNPELFALKGKNALGNEFYIPSQLTWNIDTARHPNAKASFDIVATEDNTTITITPAKPLNGKPANVPFTIHLNRGQTFSCQGLYRNAPNLLNGSHIVSDKPIAVTNKEDVLMADGTCADLAGDQLIPTTILGTEYGIVRGDLTLRDKVIILAVQNNTNIYLDGNASPIATINAGTSYEADVTNQPSLYVKANKPVYVYHYTGDGCELGGAIIPKLNCTGSASVSIVRSNPGNAFVLLITTNGNQGSFLLNGAGGIITAADFSPLVGTSGSYVFCKKDLTAQMATGTVTTFSNTSGKFQLGFINSYSGGSMYGYFSDFKKSNVSLSQAEICRFDSIQLNASGGVSYEWSPADGLNNPVISNPKASPGITTNYRVLITDEDGCVDSAFTKVILTPSTVDFNFSQDICNPKTLQFQTNNATAIEWDFGNGVQIAGGQAPSVTYNDYGTYAVTLKGKGVSGCEENIVKQIPVTISIDSTIITRDTSVCFTGNFQLKSLPALKYCWSPATGLSATDIQNPVINGFIPKRTYYLNAMQTGPNLVVNGDFSADNTGFSSDYIYKAQNISTSNYLIDISPVKGNISFSDCRDHTTGNGNMMAIDASPVANQKVWKQTITVSPNTNYAFSCWISSIYPDNPAELQFYINGNLIGNIFNASATTCQWQQFYTVWNSGNATSAEIAVVNQNTQGYGNDFALDDISFAELKIIRDSVTIAINEKPDVDFNYTVPFCKSPEINGFALNEPYPINTWWWNFGDNKTADAQTLTHSYAKGGTYNIKLIATDINGCEDSTTKTIQLDTATAIATYSGPVCPGGTISLQGAGGTTYEWTSTTPVDDPAGQNTTATLNINTKFQLKVTDNIGCEDTASVFASLIPKPAFSKPADMQTCKGNSMVLNANANPAYQYTWTPADYLSDPNAANPVATPDVSTEYTVHVLEPQCGYDTSFTVKTLISANANVFVLPNAFTPNGDGKNDCFGIRNWGNTTVHQFSIFNRWGQKVFETKDPSHCWDGKNKGQVQPSGGYIYIIKALTPCGEVERKGSFMLVR